MSSATTVVQFPSKSIYDTSIYLNAIRNRKYYDQLLPHFARTLSTTYFCAVVAQELKAGCYTSVAFSRVENFIRPFRRTGRLITPTFSDWEETGELLARMLREQSQLKDKLPQLINDTLIALCGLRLGAVVYTANRDDFALIQHYKQFHFAVV
ncbi:MAG: type II toxin-antitoxin system VapC family toxin [Candidatus Binatia bacterium]